MIIQAAIFGKYFGFFQVSFLPWALRSNMEFPPDLAGVFVLSDGLGVNGSELVRGIVAEIGPHTPLSGGLAGDGCAVAVL